MTFKMRGLGAVGAIGLSIGLYLAFASVRWLYPGLVIVVGCVILAVVLVINLASGSDTDRP
jgi:Flp pilus assembly protein TadB